MVYVGDPRELANLLKYHIGEEFLVSGGVTSHTRMKPMSGEKLELGLVRTQGLCVKTAERHSEIYFCKLLCNLV